MTSASLALDAIVSAGTVIQNFQRLWRFRIFRQVQADVRYETAFSGGQPTHFKVQSLRVNKYRGCMEIGRPSEFNSKLTTKVLVNAREV